MMNAGGLRAPISKGVVTVQNAFSLMPFENDLVVVKLSGEKVKMLFDYFIEKFPKQFLLHQLHFFSSRYNVDEAFNNIIKCSQIIRTENQQEGFDQFALKSGIQLTEIEDTSLACRGGRGMIAPLLQSTLTARHYKPTVDSVVTLYIRYWNSPTRCTRRGRFIMCR